MTISSENRIAGPFICNGASVTYPFTFKIFAAEDIAVTKTDAAGNDLLLVLTTNYFVSVNKDQEASPGGIVTAKLAYPAGVTITLTTAIAALQLVDLANQGGFYPSVISRVFDKLTILIQQLNGPISRALKFPASDGYAVSTLPSAAARAGRFLTFDALGNLQVSSGSGTDTGLRTDLAAATGAGLVGVTVPSGPPRTTQQQLDMLYFGIANVRDTQFAGGAKLDGITDDTAAFAAAVASGKNVFVPKGNMRVSAGVTNNNQTQIYGAGVGLTTITVIGSGYDVINLAASYASVSDLTFTALAARTTANAYIKLSSPTRFNSVKRCSMVNAYYGIWIAAEAVISVFEDVEILSSAPGVGVGIYLNGGNDTFLNRIVMDAPPGSQPLAGVRIQRSQATWISDSDLIHQGRGLQIDPDGLANGLITWCFFSKLACDLGSGDGLYINPLNNGIVRGLFFDNCWFSSNINGVNIIKTGTAFLDGVYLDNCTMFNNMQRGAWDQNAVNVEFNNCRVSGNSQAGSAVYPGIEFAANTINFAVRGTRSGAVAGFPASQSAGVVINSGCDYYVLTDNNVQGNATFAVSDASQPSSVSREVRGNLGYKTSSSGTATIPVGANQISVAHGLGGVPSVVVATPTNTNLAGLSFWSGTFASTTLTINTSANVTANSLFSWTASLYN